MTPNQPPDDLDEEPYAWRVKVWARLVSLSEPYVNLLIRRGKIDSVKAGSRRLITTSPLEYLDRLAEENNTEYSPRGRPIKK